MNASGLLIAWLLAASPAMGQATPVRDFEVRDVRARPQRLSQWSTDRAVVVVFLGVDCPLVKLYAQRLSQLAVEYQGRGVRLVGVDSNWHDTLGEIDSFAREHQLAFPLYKDVDHRAADALNATRTPEVFVLDAERRVRYRGRIDDRYTVTSRRESATRDDLAAAIDELLDGREVSIPQTDATGCVIARGEHASDDPAAKVTFSAHIAPLIATHCTRCHRPRQAAPFALLDYDDAFAWAETIREVVEQGRMPPWYADPRYGRFVNDNHLSDSERRLIADWVDAGCPLGDATKTKIAAPVSSPEWAIGRPDMVVSIPNTFAVPAQGVVDYQYFEVDAPLATDMWVAAAEIKPGNRAVVHHASVFLRPPGEQEVTEAGSLGSICLAAWAPGTGPLVLPTGMAKLVPAGWKLVFVVHYTPIGTPQTDRTSLGLKLTDPSSVEREVATRLLVDMQLSIPPGVADHRVEHSCVLEDDLLLLSMFPHMHARGRSFRYEAIDPSGRSEILLDVPRWDVNWQNRYDLAEPKRLPAGTTIRCTAHYDNSSANPANPDPSAHVRTGPQSWDEMFNGYFDVARVEPGLSPPPGTRGPRQANLFPALAAVLCTGLWSFVRRRKE